MEEFASFLFKNADKIGLSLVVLIGACYLIYKESSRLTGDIYKGLQEDNKQLRKYLKETQENENECRRELGLHRNKLGNLEQIVYNLHRKLEIDPPTFPDYDEDPALDPTDEGNSPVKVVPRRSHRKHK